MNVTRLALLFALAGALVYACGDDTDVRGSAGSISCDPDPDSGDDCLSYCDANECESEGEFTASSRCQDVGGGEGMCLCSCRDFNSGTGATNGAGGGGGSPGFGGFGGGPQISRECDPNDGLREANCFLYCDQVPCAGGMNFVTDSMCAQQIGGGYACECECGES